MSGRSVALDITRLLTRFSRTTPNGIEKIGKVCEIKAWMHQLRPSIGRPADSQPPAGVDYDVWLGPAPKVPFNNNRWGGKTTTFPTFRYFWDYAGGAMTDWGVHLIDPIHQCFDDPMPLAAIDLLHCRDLRREALRHLRRRQHRLLRHQALRVDSASSSRLA